MKKNMKKMTALLVLSLILMGCSTMQQRVVRLKDKGENVVSTTVEGDVEHAKSLVREVVKEMKLIEYTSGSSEFKEPDDNLILISNVSGKTVLTTALFGVFVSSPTNLGVFFNYDETNNKTLITISEETSSLSLFKLRQKIIDAIKLRSFPSASAENPIEETDSK